MSWVPSMRPVSFLLVVALAATACVNRVEDRPEGRIQLERNSEFDGSTLRFFVELEDGTELSVNTNDDVYTARPATTPLPDHRAQAITFLKDQKEGTSLAHGLLSWDPANPTDYLVFGWWAYFPDQHLPELSLEDSVQYAIVDGPEIDHGIPPVLPLDGTATYAGQAGGLYSYVPGGDPEEGRESFVIEEYQGILTLTADFGDRSVRGCIGCVGDLDTRRAHFGAILGPELGDARGVARDYELHLASAIVQENGTFERDRVTVKHPTRTVVESEGFWGGTFSNRRDMEGIPRLVAGFSGVSFTESDGSEGEFFGSLLGLSSLFAETGESGPLPSPANRTPGN